ncbi:hypothetical protein [Paludisphaera soli]|uniref:hypothetical protein n=1 Tax=Paludisphaera soli TaxID=2712865 RepID=UPI0013EA45D0|nr:hypothetical protein [Paludisphaera soli]
MEASINPFVASPKSAFYWSIARAAHRPDAVTVTTAIEAIPSDILIPRPQRNSDASHAMGSPMTARIRAPPKKVMAA